MVAKVKAAIHKRVRVQATSTVDVAVEEGPYAGLWMLCQKEVSNDGWWDFTKTVSDDADPDDKRDLQRRQLQRFGREILIEWNLDDADGNPVPATADGMTSIPQALAISLYWLWIEALVGVPSPLGDESSDGAGVSIPQIALGSRKS